MRRSILALLATTLWACGIGEPEGPDRIRGVYDLTHVDDDPLPAPVTINGVEYQAVSGAMALLAQDIVRMEVVFEPVEPGDNVTEQLQFSFRQINPDSIAFPWDNLLQEQEFFGRRSGQTFTVVSIPISDAGRSAAIRVGGAHRWTFDLR